MELTHLEPASVFHYFNEICQIPHGSYNTKAISDYCVNFAKSHHLTCYQDDTNNVIIVKEASPGYENAKPVILQGHLDMVCEKTDDSDHDFEKDPLKLRVDGDWLSAEGTTLGGDDGIAVAYGLAILEDTSLAHPKLYVIFTTEEEVGMDGAHAIDLTPVKDAGYMINLDSEEEGYILAGCAGGSRAHITLPITWEKATGLCCELAVSGLAGGHSGGEINRFGANGSVLLGMVLNTLSKDFDLKITALTGGSKDNVIPKKSTADIVITPADKDAIQAKLAELEAYYHKVYGQRDPNLTITLTDNGEGNADVMDKASADRAIFTLTQAPNGVQAMSFDIEGLVETSLNLGVMATRDHDLYLSFALRSSVGAARQALEDKLKAFVDYIGGTFDIASSYPAWEFRRESILRDKMSAIYNDMFGSEPVVQAIHAGLECGLISNKLPDLDIVSIGPDMQDIHTPDERLSIASTKRMWDYLLAVLASMKTN